MVDNKSKWLHAWSARLPALCGVLFLKKSESWTVREVENYWWMISSKYFIKKNKDISWMICFRICKTTFWILTNLSSSHPSYALANIGLGTSLKLKTGNLFCGDLLSAQSWVVWDWRLLGHVQFIGIWIDENWIGGSFWWQV